MRLLSWNVNGLRAVYKKGFVDWIFSQQPDILCLQETRVSADQVPDELQDLKGYQTYWASGERKGYSGVALFTKQQPAHVQTGFGIARFDNEGRVIVADYGRFILFNIYFPNGKASKERLQYKLDFYDACLERLDELKKKRKKIILCGDVNTAHKEIDLARPKENEKVSGFLPVERAWIDSLVAHGFVDTFRMFNADSGQYTWWDLKTRARERNVGWRIDYFFVSSNLKKKVTSAFIMANVTGSDHCPVGVEIDV
jgi:exodeoxyribonuclease-3